MTGDIGVFLVGESRTPRRGCMVLSKTFSPQNGFDWTPLFIFFLGEGASSAQIFTLK